MNDIEQSGNRKAESGNGSQLPLIEAESDEALLLDGEEFTKRFTGRTAAKLELKREFILALIGCGWDVESIAAKTGSSTRIVKLLGGKFATTVANNSKKMSQVLGNLAAKAAFHLDQKLAAAKPGELGVIIGIMLQRKMEMELAQSGVEDLNAVTIDVESENPQLKAAREFLAKREPKQLPSENLTAENAEVAEKK